VVIVGLETEQHHGKRSEGHGSPLLLDDTPFMTSAGTSI
jgi:hypothetical protein